MFVYALLAICLEVYLLWHSRFAGVSVIPETATGSEVSLSIGVEFLFITLGLFLFYAVLQRVFEIFAPTKGAAIFSLLPAILLFFMLRRVEEIPYLGVTVVISALLRLLFDFVPAPDRIIDYGALILTVAAIYMYFVPGSFKSGEFAHTLMFVCLTILTMSVIQKFIIERMKTAFPIYIFLIIGLLTLVIPVSENPIDWSHVVQAGERFSESAMETMDLISYFFSDLFHLQGFSSGYSTLGNAGGNVGTSDRTQIILRSSDSPSFIFKDPETDKDMVRRRAIYLKGGLLPDAENLIRFAHLLKSHGVDKEYARLFCRDVDISIEYAYLKTKDEIAPVNSVLLMNEQGKTISENSTMAHKKGYTLTAKYLDIDYGSPYLIDIIKDPVYENTMSYEECCEYVVNVLGINLTKIIDEESYAKLQINNIKTNESFSPENNNKNSTYNETLTQYLSTKGSSDRMQDLAAELTLNVSDTYDKCKIIEDYLRQYAYSTAVDQDKDRVSDLSTPEGISSMADSFLFETGTGYCVHFTSSMVMLLRLSGIPARIANGYRYAFPFEREDSYKVSGAYAHAWPEAYIESIGWVPFEPTPAYLTAGERSWNKAPATAPATNYAPIYNEVPHLPETIAEAPVEEAPQKRALSIVTVIIPVIASILLLLLLLIFGSSAIDKLRYRHGSADRKLRMDVDKIKKSLRKHSAEGFIDRGLLSDYVSLAPSALRDDLQKVFGIYYRLEYSTCAKEITEEESEFARSVREATLRLSGRNS